MKVFIDYFSYCVSRFIDILDSMKIGEFSILYYMLGAIIIGFIIKLVKGGSNEFEHSMNFTTGYVIDKNLSKYNSKHSQRKEQLIKESNKNKEYNPMMEIPPILREHFGGARFTRMKEFNDFERDYLR